MLRPRLLAVALAGVALAGTAAAAGAAAAPSSAVPSFTTYESPPNLGNSAGEPSIGVNPKSGAVVFQAYTETLRVTDFDKKGKGTAKWEKGVLPRHQSISLDPILRTDPQTGRTYTSQLLLACSAGAYTDDDGRTFTPSEGCGIGSAVDHQTVGFGPYVDGSPLVKNPAFNYPNVVYYCAQDIVTANCSMSNDGGLTFPVTSKVYTRADCSGLFGHIKAAPDGTVYLPPIDCTDNTAGVAVSENNGITWRLSKVPGTRVGDAGHPSVAPGTNGDVYLAYGGETKGGPGGPPMVVRSTDKGRTWTKPVALGQDVGIKNTRFVVAVAGDKDRAAVGYLGSKTGGNASDMQNFKGRWDMYVSYTYDGGKTWRTVNATKGHPVQVGSVCTAGTTCGSDRNLLDFNDAVIDPRTGRMVIGFADGCPGPDDEEECNPRMRRDKAVIAMQTGGRPLLAKYDRKR